MREWIERLVAWYRAIGREPEPRQVDTAVVMRVLESLEKERFEQRAALESMWKAHTDALEVLAVHIVAAVKAANPMIMDGGDAPEPLPAEVEAAIRMRSDGDRRLRADLVTFAMDALEEGKSPDEVVKQIKHGMSLAGL
jgi:hypothetical protein